MHFLIPSISFAVLNEVGETDIKWANMTSPFFIRSQVYDHLTTINLANSVTCTEYNAPQFSFAISLEMGSVCKYKGFHFWLLKWKSSEI